MIGRLLTLGERLAGRKEPRLWSGLGFAVLTAAVSAGIHAVLASFVAGVAEGGVDRFELMRVTGALAVLVLVEVVVARPALAAVFAAAFSLMGHSRIRFLDHLRRLPMGFFGSQRSGALAAAITTDIALIEDIWAHVLALFAADLVLPFFIGVWLFAIDWRMAVAVFFTLPAALLLLRLTLPLLLTRVRRMLEAGRELNANLVEFIQGIGVLRTFGRYGLGYERLRGSTEALRRAQMSAELGPSPLVSAYGFVIEMSVVVVMLQSAYFLLGGTLAPKTAILFLLVAASLSRRLFDLGTGILQLKMASDALARVEGFLNEAPLPEPSAPAQESGRFDVEVDRVDFEYDGERVLHGVSAKFPERSLTALVGASGAGKSTLVHLIARLWAVPKGRGEIRIGGVDIRNLTVEQHYAMLSLVFQDVVLFSGTIEENIAIGCPGAPRERVIAAAKAAQAHEFIAARPDGYETKVGEGGATLSGGERQRISIARAVLKDSPIVLLDEATASVDAFAEAELQRAIDELVKDKTVIVVAHRLRTIRRAHQILVLKSGRLVERGRHDDLVALGGEYARLWAEQGRAQLACLRGREAVAPTASAAGGA